MSRLDRAIIIGLLVAISATTGVIAAFYTGVYKPIKHNMSNVSGLNIKRDTGRLEASDGVSGAWSSTYNPQVTVNSNKIQGSL